MSIQINDLLCYKLFSIVKLNEQLIDKHMALFDLSRTQWKVITRFNFLKEPCTQQELLASVGIDRAHLTRTLEQLELRKIIKKERILNDKRAFHIYLTQSGRQLLKEIELILEKESEILIKEFSAAQQKQLEQAIDKIQKNILTAIKQS